MDSEQFFLKWNNFESNLALGFADLLQKEDMVDVTIAAEGKIIQAHKIILSICSSYFRNMFQVNPCQHPIVVLKDVRYQELTDMLDFMYKGEAKVRQEDLPSFLKLAETLKVKGLAVSQGEFQFNESSLKKKSESQISNLTKSTSTFATEEPINTFEDQEVTRKKTKRCSSPLAHPEQRILPHSPSIKMETEECDDNFMGTCLNTNGQNPVVKEERLSDSSMDSHGDNHVMNENWRVDKTAGRSTADENSEAVQQEGPQQTRNYSFLETCFGNRLLILEGYSYRRKTISVGKSYWRCCFSKCSAKGTLLEDGAFRFKSLEHNHEPDYEKIKRREKLVGLKKLALQMNIPGRRLLQTLDIKDDVEKNLAFIRTWRRRKENRSRRNAFHAGLNYLHLPSQFSQKAFLCHSGYLYRKDSVNGSEEKCIYWRCLTKTCKARAKTDGDGNLTILNALHNHSSEEKLSTQFNKEGQVVVSGPGKPNELFGMGKAVRLPQRLAKVKSTSLMEVTNSGFCSDSDSFNLEKLMAETLSDNYCDAHELSG